MKPGTKHTPGPWHARPPKAQNPSRAVVSAISGGVTIYDAPLTLETAANARLISASPDLLAACEAVYAAFGLKDTLPLGFPPALERLLKDAIAKAKGGAA